jgi:beta-galactosidase
MLNITMKKFLIYLLSLLLINHINAQTKTNGTVNFDEGWRFHLGGMLGGQEPGLNDSKWRQVDLPHDWSIEDRAGTQSPFNPDAISQVGGGFTSQGTAWYRKTFAVPLADKGKQIIIQFDGVYTNADVYVNGQHLGNHPYGYTSFYYNITGQLKYGKKNTIAVGVKNEGQNSRWYSGSGIYRHVWLKTLNPVHLTQWGTYITTPEVSEKAARVNIKLQLINEGTDNSAIEVVTKFLAPNGMEAGNTKTRINLAAGETKEFSEHADINDPQLWSCKSPSLYRAVTEIYQNEQPINTETTTFGIRKIAFDVNNGFQLNGKTIKLKGGCFHNDNGPLGPKAYDRAEERKVELLKASGYNAIRCSHNPPSPAFLDACDRLGMLVIDEAFDTWNIGKNPYDYHLYFKDWWQRDIKSMVSRDCNHPGIIMWSIGNEIPGAGTPEEAQNARMIAQYVKELDPTRPITAAVVGLDTDKDPFFAAQDVAGYNYAIDQDHPQKDQYELSHLRLPERIMFGTESYPLIAFGNWMAVEDHSYVIGDFVWTAWDYIGEASIGWRGYPQNGDFYPWNLAFCGDIDICGWKRPQSYYRDALWKKDQLSVFVVPPSPSFPKNPKIESWSKWNWADVVPEWNWEGHESKPIEVNVYSSCDKVELFLNKRSLGVKQTNRSTQFIASWTVQYQSGELKAIGYSGDKMVNKATLITAAKPVSIQLSADRKVLQANNEDLSYVTVELVDSKGHIDPKVENLVSFSLIGDGKIVGVGNANPVSLESYQLARRKAWKGRCLVIIKAGKTAGKIVLQAKSAGLKVGRITISAKK